MSLSALIFDQLWPIHQFQHTCPLPYNSFPLANTDFHVEISSLVKLCSLALQIKNLIWYCVLT